MAHEQASPEAEFKPYIPDSSVIPEFTPRAVLLGMVFGGIFGAVTVYVGLRAGLTVSASIPIAVLSISLLRALGKSTILENNIVQTTGSAGESVAAGVIFTLPALVFLGFPLQYSRIFLLAMGLGVMLLFARVPFAGWMIGMLLLVMGVGAMALNALGATVPVRVKKEKRAAVAPDTEPVSRREPTFRID